MYYKSAVEGVVRVDPSRFSEDLKKVVTEELRRNYENRVIDQLGRVIAIQSIKNIEDGIISFLSHSGEKPIILSWQIDEPKIEYWHEVDEDFEDRKQFVNLLVE